MKHFLNSLLCLLVFLGFFFVFFTRNLVDHPLAFTLLQTAPEFSLQSNETHVLRHPRVQSDCTFTLAKRFKLSENKNELWSLGSKQAVMMSRFQLQTLGRHQTQSKETCWVCRLVFKFWITTGGTHWVELFWSVKLQNSYVDYKMSP